MPKMTSDMDETHNQLRRNLKALMRHRGIKSGRLSDEAGVTRSGYYSFMSGRVRSPGLDVVIAWADVLDVTVDELIGDQWLPEAEPKGVLIRVTSSWFVAGIGYLGPYMGRPVAPILRWAVGREGIWFRKYCDSKGWKTEIVW